jgi:hypothetical protein
LEGSQALPVCPSGKCKLLTGTIEVYFLFIYLFLLALGGVNGLRLATNFEVTIGRAAYEAYRATWNLGTNSAFALGPNKTTENLDRVGRSQDLPDAN